MKINDVEKSKALNDAIKREGNNYYFMSKLTLFLLIFMTDYSPQTVGMVGFWKF
jgi:hypothetical protein